jgi:uncharacterized protein (TIGR02246 family)
MTDPTDAVESSLEALLLPLQTVVAAWSARDLPAFERIWTEDADLIAQDGTHVVGRHEICDFARGLLDGPLKNSRIVASPQRVRTLGNSVGVVQAAGGLLLPGESQVSPQRHVFQTFVLTWVGDRWLIDTCQTTRVIIRGLRP